MIKQAVKLVEGYRAGTISPVEATQEALQAIDRYDELVNPFVLVDAERALPRRLPVWLQPPLDAR